MSSQNKQQLLFAKVVIIGDSGVGKTNLMTRYCEGVFTESYVATIGVDFKLKSVQVNGTTLKLQIWDTAGQQRFKNITQTYYKGASAIVLAYSINDSVSFKSIANWLTQIDNNSKEGVIKVLVGTKCDLQQQRKVQFEQAKLVALEHYMTFFQVSAKEGRNIEQVFNSLAKEVLQQRNSSKAETVSAGIKITGTSVQGKNCAC